MRHVGGALIGLVVAAIALVVLSGGFRMATIALARLRVDSLYAAFPVLLIGGALLGAVLVAGRLSRAAPLTAGVVLLVVGIVAVVDPLAFAVLGGRGMVEMTSQQVVVTYAAIVLVGAFAVRPSPARVPGQYGPPPTGHWPAPGGPPASYQPGSVGPPATYQSGPAGAPHQLGSVGAPHQPGPPGTYQPGPGAPSGVYPRGPSGIHQPGGPPGAAPDPGGPEPAGPQAVPRPGEHGPDPRRADGHPLS